MLALSRHINERILIGDDPAIVVTVIAIIGSGPNAKVRLGIEAPADVPVDREEVRLAKLREGRGPRPLIDRPAIRRY